MLTLSWCGGSIRVTSNAWWDRSHDTTPPRQTPPLGRHPHPWADTPSLGRHPPPMMVNEWGVCILLECILVFTFFGSQWSRVCWDIFIVAGTCIYCMLPVVYFSMRWKHNDFKSCAMKCKMKFCFVLISSQWPDNESHMATVCYHFVTAGKRSLGQGNIFAPVCHSVHRAGVYPSMHLGHYISSCTLLTLSWCGGSIQVTSNAWWDRSHDTTPPPRQTPPLGRHPHPWPPPSLGRHPSLRHPPPWADTPLQWWSMSGRYASYWNAFLFLLFLVHNGRGSVETFL